MYILGLSAFYHDSSAALIKDGKIIACAQEERFTRKKHDSSFPSNAIKFCLDKAGIGMSELTNMVFYEKPFLKFERLLESYLATVPKGFHSFKLAIPLWIKKKLFQKKDLMNALKDIELTTDLGNKLLFTEHHQGHAASAFYPSPFEDALILTMDGVGEWATNTVALGHGNDLKIVKEMHFPHSLGLLYSAFTYYLGFKVNSGEYKVMGLAPYGKPKYLDLILNELIDLKEDGSYRLNLKYFDFVTGLTMTNDHFNTLFGAAPRENEANLTQREMDLAASIQAATEEIVLRMTKNLTQTYDTKNLCLAGGVALNCVANGKILKQGYVKQLWVQPAAGDAGGSLGAAMSAYYQHHKRPRLVSKTDSMQGAYLGPEHSTTQIKKTLSQVGAIYTEYTEQEIIKLTATYLSEGKAIGWFQGRMEFGPRALGARSIIADARSPTMQKLLNLKVKYRESFRPFAPSILQEEVGKWFNQGIESPYMTLVDQITKDKCHKLSPKDCALFGIDKLNVVRSEIPAVTHVDYSARIQTVNKQTNRKYWHLIHKFNEITGCPVIVNTSFNVRGEPLVCTPLDAFNCFMGTELDVLVIGNFILQKEQQDPSLKKNYASEFELD